MAKWDLAQLKRAKEERGMILQQLTDATGLPMSTVRQYIQGFVIRPDLGKMTLIAKALGVSLNELIVRDEDLGEVVRPCAEVAGRAKDGQSSNLRRAR